MKLLRLLLLIGCVASARGQSIAIPWSGHGHDPQHSSISKTAGQPLSQIKWQQLIDLNRVYSGTSLLIHYGVPLVTRQNTIVIPVKTGADGGFQVEGHDATNGAIKWTLVSDYILPTHDWVPEFGICLTPKNRVYYPGIGGTVYYRDNPDAASGPTGQLAFFGLSNYQANPADFNSKIKINTPIVSDRYGNIYFGYDVLGTTNPVIAPGIARIAEDGTGSWVAGAAAANDVTTSRTVVNCAPALSNDGKTLYGVVRFNSSPAGYLVSVDARTMTPISRVRLKDVANPTSDAFVFDSGSASPAVGPDGDVYIGVLESAIPAHNGRGWMLHYDSTLTQSKTPGSFGWDDTPSIVPASLVPSYHGNSSYLLLCKYNNYAGYGTGDGVNKVAILDPNDTQSDPITPSVTTMKEILTVVSPTHVDEGSGYPNAVSEWCINAAAVDPFAKAAFLSCEDGKTYRWDFTTNTLSQSIVLTDGLGEAYTPTFIGVDGTVYAIANGILFAIGAAP